MDGAKLVLITGASSGIGAAFALAYAKRGLDVALVSRRIDRLEQLASDLSKMTGVNALVIPADLSMPEAHTLVLRELRARGRDVTVLVNSAGYGIAQPFVQTEWERQSEFLMVSIVNLCGLTYGVLPGMIRRGRGNVINVASIVAITPELPGYTLYPAAKSFVLKFSRSLRAEVCRAGVSVTAVCPGYTPTEFHKVNGTDRLLGAAPRTFFTSADFVAEAAITANARGRAMVVPGLHNKLAIGLIKYLPNRLVVPILRAASSKYRP